MSVPPPERAFGPALRDAARGLALAWRSQRNLRIESAIGAAALLAAALLRAPLAPVLLACGLVLSVELLNTAVEALVDLASPEWHDLARTAKDCAAAAVLVAACFAALVGLAVLGPPLVRLAAP